MVADITRLISASSHNQPLHIRPTWSHRKSFLLEYTRAINAGCQANSTPRAHFGMAEERAQGLRTRGQGNASTSLIETSAKERFSSLNQPRNVSTCQHRLRIVTADRPRCSRI